MKNLIQNKFKDLRKSIISVLSSNAFKAAIFLLLSLALFACSSDTPTEKSNEITDTEVNNPSQKPETPEVPDNSETPDTPETPDDPNTPTISDTPEEPEEPGDPTEPGEDDPVVTPAPVEITAEMRVEALKNIFGITDLTGGISSDINLTAQTIKVLGDISSDSISKEDIKSASEKDENTLTALREKYGIILSGENVDVKNAIAYYVANPSFITREESNPHSSDEYRKANAEFVGLVYKNNYDTTESEEKFKNNIPYYIVNNVNNINFSLNGNFYYDDLQIKVNNKVSVDNAIFSMKEKENYIVTPNAILNIYKDLNGYDKEFNYADILIKDHEAKDNLDLVFPKLDFYVLDENYISTDKTGTSYKNQRDMLTLMDLYVRKEKSDNFKIINLVNNKDHEGTGVYVPRFDGKDYSDISASLFVNDEVNSSVPNIDVKTLFQINKNYPYVDVSDNSFKNIRNLQITGNYTDESEDINSTFTNVIFEGDVSGIKNSAKDQFNGVVYFKDKTYNIIETENNLNSASMLNGILKLKKELSNNIKLEGGSDGSVIDFRDIDKNSLINYDGKYILKEGGIIGVYYPENISEEEAKIINEKFADKEHGGFIFNAYSGDSKIYTHINNYGIGYGSSRETRSLAEFEYFGNNGKFEKSAYETYENASEEYNKLTQNEKDELEADKDKKLIANNNKTKPRAAYI